MTENGPYIWCLVNGDEIIPLGNGKSLEWALELGPKAYTGKVILYKLVEVKTNKDTCEKAQPL